MGWVWLKIEKKAMDLVGLVVVGLVISVVKILDLMQTKIQLVGG